MTISRTVVYALVNMLLAVLTAAGVTLSEDMRNTLMQNIDLVLTAGLAVNGVVVYVLRALTDSPLMGWFKK